MALFCAAIKRDPVSLLSFPFQSHIIFSLFFAWNIHTVVFLPIFVLLLLLFLVLCVLFLIAVINLCSFLCSLPGLTMPSSILTSPLQPYLFDMYNLSIWSLGLLLLLSLLLSYHIYPIPLRSKAGQDMTQGQLCEM